MGSKSCDKEYQQGFGRNGKFGPYILEGPVRAELITIDPTIDREGVKVRDPDPACLSVGVRDSDSDGCPGSKVSLPHYSHGPGQQGLIRMKRPAVDGIDDRYAQRLGSPHNIRAGSCAMGVYQFPLLFFQEFLYFAPFGQVEGFFRVDHTGVYAHCPQLINHRAICKRKNYRVKSCSVEVLNET